MESPVGNIPGIFDELELTCPRCGSNQVMASANENGYFCVTECHKCGYRNNCNL